MRTLLVSLFVMVGISGFAQSPVPVLTNPTNDAVVVPTGFWTGNRLAILATLSLETEINAGVPNGAGALIHWSQLLGVPEGLADGTDDGAGGGTNFIAAVSADFEVLSATLSLTNVTGTGQILRASALSGYLLSSTAASTFATIASPTFTGTATFDDFSATTLTVTGSLIVPADPYDSGWNADTGAARKDDIYDAMELRAPKLLPTLSSPTFNGLVSFAQETLSPSGGTNYILNVTNAPRGFIQVTNHVSITGSTNAAAGREYALTLVNTSGSNYDLRIPAGWFRVNGLSASQTMTNNTVFVLGLRWYGGNNESNAIVGGSWGTR